MCFSSNVFKLNFHCSECTFSLCSPKKPQNMICDMTNCLECKTVPIVSLHGELNDHVDWAWTVTGGLSSRWMRYFVICAYIIGFFGIRSTCHCKDFVLVILLFLITFFQTLHNSPCWPKEESDCILEVKCHCNPMCDTHMNTNKKKPWKTSKPLKRGFDFHCDLKSCDHNIPRMLWMIFVKL